MSRHKTVIDFFFAKSAEEHLKLSALLSEEANCIFRQMEDFLRVIAESLGKDSKWLDSSAPRNIAIRMLEWRDKMVEARALHIAVASLKQMLDFEKGESNEQE